MNKKILFFAFAGIFASAQALFAQEFQGVRANPDPLEERIRLNPEYIPNYRELMRNIVETLKDYVRETKPDFLIIADGATELLTRGEWENALDELHRAEAAGAKTEDERYLLKLFSPEDLIPEGTPDRRYIQSLNAVLVTNAVCGKNALPDKTKKLLNEFGVSVLGAEHCKTEKEKNNALLSLAKQGIPAHTDTDAKGSFDFLPPDAVPFNENVDNVLSLKDVKNMMIMTNSRRYASKGEWVDALSDTNYDLLIVDPFFKFSQPLTAEDVARLRQKKIGARRLVFAVLDVAVAEDTRPYWQSTWELNDPAWLRFPDKENPAGTVADYWNSEWKRIVGIYFKSIMDMGYDGVVLKGLDRHKTFERIIPIT